MSSSDSNFSDKSLITRGGVGGVNMPNRDTFRIIQNLVDLLIEHSENRILTPLSYLFKVSIGI